MVTTPEPECQNPVGPSSQGPCICPDPDLGWANNCPRHEHMQDTWDFDPFRWRVAEKAWSEGAMPS